MALDHWIAITLLPAFALIAVPSFACNDPGDLERKVDQLSMTDPH